MMNNIVVYTKDNCIWCTRAKNLLNARNMEHQVVHMPSDISREELLLKFPQAKTMPIITIDDKWIGGYSELEGLVLKNLT